MSLHSTLALKPERSYASGRQVNAPARLEPPGAGHGGIRSMSESKASAGPADRFKRRTTRHRGISYRLRVDGSRAYSV